MESGGGLVTSAGHSSPSSVPSLQSSRKEWKAGNDHLLRDSGVQEMERSKLSQSDEKTIYEQGTGPLDVDFCSITIHNEANDDPLQQRLGDVTRRREELQHMEIELRARVIARTEIVEMRKGLESQLKDHAEAYANLKVQLQEREEFIHELEKKMEDMDRELRAIKLDNEKAWAKEDLLREQNKELATFRRERDNSDAERAQHIAQIHELKAHIQEKERQFIELEEQQRVAQETIMYKDGQLREAQTWIARVQEMDAFQLTANHSLQAELRERTDQYNQLWLGCQRQLADMERHHMQTVQQLQAELAETRERCGIYSEDVIVPRVNEKDSSQYVPKNGNQFVMKDGAGSSSNSMVLPNGNTESSPSFASTINISPKLDHAPGVTVVPSSVYGMNGFVPPGHVPPLHPYIMHQNGIPHTVTSANSHISQSQIGHYGQVASLQSNQYTMEQQAVPENSKMTIQNQHLPASQMDPSSLVSPIGFDYESAPENRGNDTDYLTSQQDPSQAPVTVGITVSKEGQEQEQDQNQCIKDASHFHDSSLKLSEPVGLKEKTFPEHDVLQQQDASIRKDPANSPPQGQSAIFLDRTNHVKGEQALTVEQLMTSSAMPHSGVSSQASCYENIAEGKEGHAVPSEERLLSSVLSGSQMAAKVLEPALLDERSLLACIVRAIPAGNIGHIRISTTLPNRLAKMLAPLHWHDYKKKYGKLDEFVASHPELFVIEGDFVHLREGAQAIISATTAVAKVAAAAAALPSSSACLSTVSVTPAAQIQRLRKASSFVPKSGSDVSYVEHGARPDGGDTRFTVSSPWTLEVNGVSRDRLQGTSGPNIKILSNRKDVLAQNGHIKEVKHDKPSSHDNVGRSENSGKASFIDFHSAPSMNERRGSNSGVKQIARVAGAGLTSRR
ncbi:unnamed protein product [Victoria cruziana]